MPSHRFRLRVALVAFAALALQPMPAIAEATRETAPRDGPEVRWTYATWGARRAFTAGVEQLAERLSDRTAGRFRIEISYGLVGAREMLDGLQLGAFQMAHFCAYFHPAKTPSFMVFSLPFLPLGDPAVHVAVADAFMDHPAARKDLARWNAVPYASAVLPQYEFLGRGAPPRHLEDWDGMAVRAGGGIGDAMARLGASLQTVPPTEVFTLLEQGTVDAVSLPHTYAHASYRIHEVADWYTANLNPGTAECTLAINSEAMQALPAAYRGLLYELKPAYYEAQLAAYAAADAKNLPVFDERLIRIEYDEASRQAFRKRAAQPVWEDWIAANPEIPARDLLDFVLRRAHHAAPSR